MPAHAAQTVGYTTAGLLIAATLLLVVGPDRASALVGPAASPSAAAPSAASPSAASPSAASPSAASPSPVADSTTPSKPGSSSASASASAKKAAPYRVVGLGDSVPAGNACGCTTYVDLVGRQAANRQGTTADVSNLAQGGLTTPGLLDQLKDGSVKKKIAAADLVIITIGANDFDTGSVGSSSCAGLYCFQSTLKQQKSQLDEVFDRVEGLLDPDATVLVTGYWNVFLDGDVAATRGAGYVRNSVALTRAENDQIEATAEQNGATYVDIFTPFKGSSGTRNDTSLLAADGDHPNAAGHRKIAATLAAALSRLMP
ncbi:SGNH/GDSL hydrolase family protein [Actinoplanes sp. NPDC051343]|uniref:SGNH/GDSL hydrolase family protein n=1 Tax=Actinoplanes sp. NPDC051343 TaxID=3363906 RepID=UPI0037B32910